MQEIIRNLQRTVDRDGKKNIVNVDRNDVLEGGLRAFSRMNFQPRHLLSVRFTSEDGIDSGGLTKEFLRLSLLELQKSQMFVGRENSKHLSLDYNCLHKRLYESAGKLMAYSIIHNGPLPTFFSEPLYRAVVGNGSSFTVDIEDVTDAVLKGQLQTILDADDDEKFHNAIEPLTDFIEIAGCTAICRNSSSRFMLVKGLAYFSIIGRASAAIDQLKSGLESLGLLSAIQNHPDILKCAFKYCPTMLDATTIEEVFEISTRSEKGSNRYNRENVTITHWRNLLQDLEESGQLVGLLVFATGSDAIPPCGFDIKPTIAFRHDTEPNDPTYGYPIGNTCTNCLQLPITSSYDLFASNMISAINMPITFTLE